MAAPTDAAIAELQSALETCCAELAAALEEESGAGTGTGTGAGTGTGTGTGAGGEALPAWRPLLLLAPPGLEQLVSIIKPPLQVIIAVLQFISALLQALAAILIGLPDPFKALIMAAYALLKDIINDLLNCGGYLYFDAPGISPTEVNLEEMGLPLHPVKDFKAGQALQRPPVAPDAYARWASRFAASFDDPGDDQRPVVTDGAPVQAVFIVMAAPSLQALRQALYLLGKLFNIDAFKKAFEKYQKGSKDPRRSRARGKKVAPDWKAKRLRDIFKDLRQLEQLPEALLGLLTSIDNLASLLKNLAAAMQDKAQVLLKLAEAIQAIIDLLDALKSTGMYALAVSTRGGVAGLKEAFAKATNRPPGGYVGGLCLLASGPNLAKAAMLWEILGMSTAMDLAEGKISLNDVGEQIKAGALGQAASVLEAQAGEVKDAWGNLKSKAKEGADAFVDAVKDAGPGFAAAVGRLPEELEAGAKRARSELVEVLEQSKAQLPTSENIKKGIEATKQARRRGGRSLAMGLGGAPPSERRPSPEPPAPQDTSGTAKGGSGK